MAVKNINAKIYQRIDTSSNWTTLNPKLGAGEIGVESNTGLVKIGNGVSNWNNLAYINQFGKVNNLSVAKSAADFAYLQSTEAQFIIDVM